MAFPSYIALIDESGEIHPTELADTAAALQRQLNEHLKPAWSHAPGTVLAFDTIDDTPLEFWPIVILNELDEPGAAGYHTDENGQPYSLVQYESDWSVTASHEMLEMVLDPFGSRLYVAPTPEPGVHKTVKILLELCDPVERDTYDIDGVEVSNFILHQYGNGRIGPYDYLGLVTRAREVRDGGFISWVESDGTWKQLTNFGGPDVSVLGKRDPNDPRSNREWIESVELPD